MIRIPLPLQHGKEGVAEEVMFGRLRLNQTAIIPCHDSGFSERIVIGGGQAIRRPGGARSSSRPGPKPTGFGQAALSRHSASRSAMTSSKAEIVCWMAAIF